MRPDLRSFADLRVHLTQLGARPVHSRRFLRTWLSGREPASAESPRDARTPRRLLEALPELQAQLASLVTDVAMVQATDGSRRRLLGLTSGQSIEMVDLPRNGLCISTQVGCAVGCRFCRTGEQGLLQQLSTLEILAQVARARRDRMVRRVVFMGMGEPAHNLEAVCEAIGALGAEGGLAHKALVFSTVGEPEVFDRLWQGSVRPALALSLHTLDAERRAFLLPRAPRVEPRVLLRSALDYADRTRYPLLVQWTLLAGVNDAVEQARELATQLDGRRAIVNYIPFNQVEGSGFERPSVDRCVELVRAVRSAGGLATLRFSAGQEAEAGCGQLRARFPRSSPI